MLLFLAAQGCARDEEAQAGPKGGGSLQYTKEQLIFFYTTKGKDGPWMGVDFFPGMNSFIFFSILQAKRAK